VIVFVVVDVSLPATLVTTTFILRMAQVTNGNSSHFNRIQNGMNNLNVVIASRMLNIMVNRDEETLVHAIISDQNTRGRLETAVQIFAPIEMYLKLAQSNSFFLSDVYHQWREFTILRKAFNNIIKLTPA
jgi:hypothetical protein